VDSLWCEDNWYGSVTSQAWPGTPYDVGRERWQAEVGGRPSSRELKAIFGEEMALGRVPGWAEEIVDRLIAVLPPCGHYTFPRPLLQVCEAIRDESCLTFVCGCYTAGSERKASASHNARYRNCCMP